MTLITMQLYIRDLAPGIQALYMDIGVAEEVTFKFKIKKKTKHQ